MISIFFRIFTDRWKHGYL